MTRYECSVCGYIFDEKTEGKWKKDYVCPVCDSDASLFNKIEGNLSRSPSEKIHDYLSDWKRMHDDHEIHMSDIHKIAETGESIIEPMNSKKPVISWDDILIKGAQLAKIPLHQDDHVTTKTVIGPDAKRPLVIETPIMISHMSFGALSREAKTALAKGSANVKTAMSSGEGGILKSSIDSSYRYIFEYIPNEYSVTDENLKKVDAIEIKFGQSSKPGMGGHLPADKVTEEIAEVRKKPLGKDIHSPPHFPDIKTRQELKEKIGWLRRMSDGRPIGIKIAAGNIEDDLSVAVYAKPDFITIDGRRGATGASPKFVKDATSVPSIYALNRARKFLEKHGRNISLIITGGLRISPDFAKALAMGADAVAIGSSAMMAIGCQQYRICNTGRCPVGIATHDPILRKRLDIDRSAERLANFLRVSTEELKTFARLTGNDDVHGLSLDDLCTTNREISKHTDIMHAGDADEK